MQTTPSRLRTLIAILCAGLCSHVASAQQLAPPAVRFADVDLEKSLLTVNGKSDAPDAGVVRAVLGLPGAPKDAIGVRQADSWELRIAFHKPLAVGTALFLSAARQNEAAILRSDYEGDPAKAVETDWLPIGPSRVLEPGARVRAVRLTGRQTQWHMNSVRCLLLISRFDSATSEAVGSGEPGPFGSHPNAIPRGETWVNAAPDPNPGSAKQVPRGPVSDALPSWYILSWDKPQTIRAVRVNGNAEKYSLAVYRGDPKQNPALAGPKDWVIVPLDSVVEVNGSESDRLIPFAPTETLAIRLMMTQTRGGAVASLERFDALTDLGDRPVPVRKSEATQFPIPYEQPFDGMMAMAISDAAGKPIRTLVSQVDRKKGSQVESWNLRDDEGNIVPPGNYRWKAITAPPLDLRYQFSVYPNVAAHHPDRLPWLTGESGPNGWLADHSSPTSGAARGDKVYFAAPWVESGVSLIECDQSGKKLWARHSFAGFSGPDFVAAETDAVYTLCRDKLERMDPATREWTRLGSTARAGRGGSVTGMAAAGGKLFVAFNGADAAFENAARAGDVDIERCLPQYPERIADPTGTRRVAPNPRQEFLRLLRLTGTPSGQSYPAKESREGHFPIDLETVGDAREQFILISFKTAVPLGSIVFPCPGPEYRVEFAALKADAAYPANPRDSKSWEAFASKPMAGWMCVAAPPETATRALRVRVTKSGDAKTTDDPLTDLLDTKPKVNDPPNIDGGLTPKKDPSGISGPPKSEWFARIEGMRMLRRRFEPVAGIRVRVNSGAIGKDGVWDAARIEPLSAEKPGIYVCEWDKPQAVSGLAIKEIHGARTEIDVWDGPAAGPIELDAAAGWKQVAVYNQARRDSYEPAFERNDCARYLDGMVDFGGPITTRAIRLRVVSQWTDNGERGTASGQRNREARSLDLRRCKVFGVLPLKALGGEPAPDPVANRRIEIRDGKTGELKKELPLSSLAGLAVGPGGELYTVQSGRVVQIDGETGAVKPVLTAIDGAKITASRIAVGPDGNLFVHVLPQHVVQVFKPNGELVRTIGKPGGQKPGPWDPEKFAAIAALVVDGRGGLWVIEYQDKPRRIVQYGPNGDFVAEHFGNTNYGGGGVLDRFDKSRLFFGRVQFEIDWTTGQSRVKNLLAEQLPDDLVPVRFRDRTYLASAPLSHSPTMPTATIYLLDEAAGTARPVAAFGEAEGVELLNVSSVLAKLAPGKVPADYTFLWTDRNGDGKASADEVVWELKPVANVRGQLGRFNEAFRVRAGPWVYEPAEVLANGAPVFVKKSSAASGLYELTDGRVLAMNERDKSGRESAPSHTVVRTADSKQMWQYPTSYSGVSGLFLPPWRPGYVTNEFGVIGHETETRGDLGEYFVTSGNNGRWNLWTADGLLAGHVLRHKLDPRGRDLGTYRDGKRGADLNDMTGGQEHFHAFLTRTDADGKTYIVHGHNLIAVTEVVGLDRFRRLSGTLAVSADDIRRVRTWDTEQARKEAKSRARVAECVLSKTATPLEAAAMEGAKLALGYDEKFLYAKWTVEGQGPLKNAGPDFRRYFKTGAYVDLMLGTDPSADNTRQGPVRGDLRILITVIDGKPTAVLYQSIAAGGANADAWETSTPAAGTTKFDRVVRFTDAVVSVQQTNGGYTVAAAFPLATLGLKPADGIRVRFDWGVQSTDDGRSAKRRDYWSNVLANGTTDEALEARLEPHLWGTLAFSLKSAVERKLDNITTPPRDPKNDLDSILDGLKKKP